MRPEPQTDDERRASAECHEASHAVVGHFQGTRIRGIVVRPVEDGLAGFTMQQSRPDLSPLEADIVELTILEAGAIGCALRSGPTPPRSSDAEAELVALTPRLVEALPANDREHVLHALADSRPGADSMDDEAAIAAIAARYAPDEAVWLMAFCRARATRLIAEHRDTILALAAELSRRPILDGPAAEAVIQAHERSSHMAAPTIPKVDKSKVYVCIESHVSDRGTFRAGDRLRGSHEDVQNVPACWVEDGLTTDEITPCTRRASCASTEERTPDDHPNTPD